YDNNALSLAKMEAQKVYDRNDDDRWEAAWIMGLCNERLGRRDAARANFEIAANAPDPTLASRARAMLGQNMLQSGHAEAAAIQFEQAWPHLTGNDRRECAQHAAAAWAQAGQHDQARRWSQLAVAPSSSQATSGGSASKEESLFHLQVGAYRDVTGAKRAQGNLVAAAQNAGVHAPVIRTRTDRHGGTLYLVQLGEFQTRTEADAARRSMRNHNLIVVADQ
ncbi:MAG: SPOR domain-containing protein, partial [Phycisphaerales bacterium]|nr:SPOR domain-containing protein [Phycisphaerales bacterium]